MRCMHLSIDELHKRVTLCIIAALECREHYLSKPQQRRWKEGFEGTRTPPPKQFNAARRPGRLTTVREAEYEYKVGKRHGTGDQEL